MIMRTLLPVLTLLLAGAADAAELQWKLNKGDRLSYNIQSQMTTSSTVAGFDSQSKVTQTMKMQWTVVDRAADNTAIVEQTIRQIIIEMSPDGKNKLLFNSAAKDRPQDPIVRSLSNVYGKIVNQKFQVWMAPTGQIQDVRVPEGLLETLKTAAAGSPAGLDDEALKQLLSQTSVILPNRSVDIGDTWESAQTLELPFATIEMRPEMSLEEIRQGNATIGYRPSIQLVPKKNAAVQVTLKGSDGSGQITFDVDRGRIVEMQLNMNMDLVSMAQGRSVSQKVRQQTTMELAE